MREKRREKKLGNSATQESERKTTKTKLTNQWIYQNLERTWPLLGVEDTVDRKQWGTEGQKNEENNENNKFVRQCSIVTCLVSSTPRRSPNLKTIAWFVGGGQLKVVNILL